MTDRMAEFRKRRGQIRAAVESYRSGPVWPVESKYTRISQGVHAGHVAIDVAVPENRPVYAAISGEIERVVRNDPRGYGHLVIVKHTDGTRGFYAHLNGFAVSEGQRVRAGQQLGISGNTGNSSGPHLHFEIRSSGGNAIDPRPFLEQSDLRFSNMPAGRITIPDTLAVRQGAPPRVRPDPLFAGVAEAVGAAPAAVDADLDAQKLFDTPFGPITTPRIDWASVGMGAAGVGLMAVGVVIMLRSSNLLSTAAGAINPAAGAAVELLT